MVEPGHPFERREPSIPWDADRLWDNAPPGHLRAMRSVLEDLVGSGGRDEAQPRNAVLACNRPLLFKREMRTALYRALDVDRGLAPEADARRVREMIEWLVTQSRRMVGD